MRSYDDPNCTVNREQVAVDGAFLFFGKVKLRAIHSFNKKAPKTAATLQLKIDGEQVGEVILTENFSGMVQSSSLLDIMVPQGAVVEISGAPEGYGFVAEYFVQPDADETTTNADRR